MRALLLALLSVHALAAASADRRLGKLVQHDAPASVWCLSLLPFEISQLVFVCVCVFLECNNEVNHNSGLARRGCFFYAN